MATTDATPWVRAVRWDIAVMLYPAATVAGDAPAASRSLPAETFLRLVYGRLGSSDEAGLTASGVTVTELKSVFPGF